MNDAGSTHEGEFHGVGLTAPAHGAKRKPFFRALGVAAALGLSACSTPGPSHAYVFAPARDAILRDIDPVSGDERGRLPSFVDAGQKAIAMAYDPYTDHLFIRIYPGNFIRVVDRPAGVIKREFLAPSLPLGGHDFAVRSLDRHFFFTEPTAPALIETDLNGNLENYIQLAGLNAPVWGVAYDSDAKELLVLAQETSDRVYRFDLAGRARGELPLDRKVRGLSLGYDSGTRLCFAVLADGAGVGVFDGRGRLTRTLPPPLSPSGDVFVDVGPRSLVRLF